MHYWFLAAAFFAFHLLLAYLVDHVSRTRRVRIAAAVSMALVVSYLRLVAGMRQALLFAGGAQIVFLVLFSYAFFFEGFTGLAITSAPIVTLFGLMQMTARVSWDDVFWWRRDRPVSGVEKERRDDPLTCAAGDGVRRSSCATWRSSWTRFARPSSWI